MRQDVCSWDLTGGKKVTPSDGGLGRDGSAGSGLLDLCCRARSMSCGLCSQLLGNQGRAWGMGSILAAFHAWVGRRLWLGGGWCCCTGRTRLQIACYFAACLQCCSFILVLHTDTGHDACEQVSCCPPGEGQQIFLRAVKASAAALRSHFGPRKRSRSCDSLTSLTGLNT